MAKRVVITGIGVICPIGIGSKTFWENLLAGQCGIHKIRNFDAGGFNCQIAGEVPDYKIGDFVPKSYRKATKVMARDIELAVVAADDAFKDAGLKSKAYTETPDFNVKRFGCNIGAGLISCEVNEIANAVMTSVRDDDPGQIDMRKWGRDGMNQLTPLWLLKYLPNMLACHVTIVHGLMGPSNTITCQEASSHLAIGEAFRTIQRGNAELAICGGAESRINPMGMIRQELLGRLNNDANDNPAESVRPFDADAKGAIYGEGGGLLILEEYEHAKKRGAKIYAELIGFAASQDTYSVTEPDPTGQSYAKAVENALKDAGITPKDIDVFIPNGIGLPGSDRAELNGLRKALGPDLERIAFAPIKPQIAYLGAGSGVDAAAAALTISTGKIPPAKNSKKIIDNQKLNVSDTYREMPVKVAVNTVYSLGGQNAALVFRRVE
ncbi:MAG TPA: beta-ketoacyl-[acyl-carrier-protein] synthase family protein [Tepidisphaeraceae bacterium]|jgi:3-oxoacyl-[acyl-carrier-protein] synthase II|nr:beta-ketoacyl-[acyl-carrier-protein] synthase family protein [Tepidisphaeraceae bacterium]